MNTETPKSFALSRIVSSSETDVAPGFSRKIAWHPMPRQLAKRPGLSDVPNNKTIKLVMLRWLIFLGIEEKKLLTSTNYCKSLHSILYGWNVFYMLKELDSFGSFERFLKVGKLRTSWA